MFTPNVSNGRPPNMDPIEALKKILTILANVQRREKKTDASHGARQFSDLEDAIFIAEQAIAKFEGKI